MSYKFTKLSDVLSVSELPEGANAIIESNGEIRRAPSSSAASEWISSNGENVLSHLSDNIKHITEIERDEWNNKQDKLIAGDNITISEDGKTISAIGGSVQFDWNQNDSTAADYVKNRPFYTGDAIETAVVEESVVSFTENEGRYAGEFASTFTPTVGNTYKVYWDSTAYECICINFEHMLCLGNMSILGFGSFSDTGEPFLMACGNGGFEVITKDTSASHTISINELVIEVVKIDKKYLPFLSKPSGESYLTFSSQNSFTLATNGNTKSWDGTLEYFASDDTWTVWDGASVLSAELNGTEYVIYVRGTGNTVITGMHGSSWKLNGSGIACTGNIEVLLDYATVESGEHPVMGDWCYSGIFQDCTSLIQAPELSATTLTQECYNHMFDYCTSLIQAPKLPATTLAPWCYEYMFQDCRSLMYPPELPATTVQQGCYRSMFQGCTSLVQLPDLPATRLENYCYNSMFSGCASIKLSATKTGEYTQEYRVPFSGNGTNWEYALTLMFKSTGGTFTETPKVNTTYYLSFDNMIARGTEIATLNGYVQSMIDAAVDIPAALPNPNAITFTGAVEGSYDGSEPLTVNIPSGSDATYDDTELRQRVDAIEAKESIWDAKSNFSGSYNDLTDKPIITNNTTVFYLSNDQTITHADGTEVTAQEAYNAFMNTRILIAFEKEVVGVVSIEWYDNNSAWDDPTNVGYVKLFCIIKVSNTAGIQSIDVGDITLLPPV